MRTRLAIAAVAVAAAAGCADRDFAYDAGSQASLIDVGVTFTRDASGVRLEAQGHFARVPAGAEARAATLLGLGTDAPALDTCKLVDGAAELDRAFAGDLAAIQLLDAGTLAVRGPRDAATLERRRYPELTSAVTGLVYAAGTDARLSLDPGASYELLGDGGSDVGPVAATVLAPRAFPSLQPPVLRRGGDLELRWEPGEPDGALDITVAWAAARGTRELRCHVRDDGNFVVSRALAAALPSSTTPVEVSATRTARARFFAPGGGEGGFAVSLRDVAPLAAEPAP